MFIRPIRINNLRQAGVSAQLHDVIFAAAHGEAEDGDLVSATARSGHVYYGMALGLVEGGESPPLDLAGQQKVERLLWRPRVEGDTSSLYRATQLILTFPQLLDASPGSGFLDIVSDRDGVYRRAPLLVRYGDAFLPSQPLTVLCGFLGVAPEELLLKPGQSLTLPGARLPSSSVSRDIVIPIDRQGRMIVNYVGAWARMKHYPFSAIYDASDDRFMMEGLSAELEGTIVVVAWASTGQIDIGPVPTDRSYPMSGLHANVINTVLTGRFLRQASPLEMLLWVEMPLLLLLGLAGLRLSTLGFVAVAAGLVVAYAGVAALAFLRGDLILDFPRPIMSLVGATIAVTAYQYHIESQARAVLRSTFNAYFPPSVVDKVMGQPGQLADAAQKKELTILFSDIKNFTTHTSEMEASHVRTLLNEYFGRMIDIVFEHEGTVDKFIGDGLMVFFGDPEPQPDHALRCVRAAQCMQRAADELDRQWAAQGDMPLRIRIGINTGEVIVGNMGSARRLSYTVLGAPVNLAQRLESNAPVGGILISRRTFELVRDHVATKSHDPIVVKGIDGQIEVYEVPIDED